MSNDGVETILFDVEHFIKEIEMRPPLWDSRSAEYMNKARKQECWEDLCRELNDGYDSMSRLAQYEMERECKRRWKGIRSSFSREILRKKTAKSGSANARKKYVYYDLLHFLLPVTTTRGTTSNAEEDTETHEEPSADNSLNQTSIRPTKKRRHAIIWQSSDVSLKNLSEELRRRTGFEETERPQRRMGFEETERPQRQTAFEETERPQRSITAEDTQQRIPAKDAECSQKTTEDAETYFLLSLVKDLRCVPEEFKMDAKMEIMSVLKKYKFLTPTSHYNNPSCPAVTSFQDLSNYTNPTTTSHILPPQFPKVYADPIQVSPGESSTSNFEYNSRVSSPSSTSSIIEKKFCAENS